MRSFLIICGIAIAAVVNCAAQAPNPLGWDPYMTFAGNFDVGYHKTQFFEPRHNVVVGQWDMRLEGWVWPFRKRFSWGPYVRATGIAASKPEAWENAWLAKPGVGFQIYPFSLPALRNSSNKAARILGPLRLFGEYNLIDYWGEKNSWRPRKQWRAGAEHWRSLHVNDVSSRWWAETWNGLWWQSTNEFKPDYDSVIFANAVRSGVRTTHRPVLAAITPYGAIESSLTNNIVRQLRQPAVPGGPPLYYWENRLLAGAGIRIAPPVGGRFQDRTRLNRFAVYAEYLRVATYYGQPPPPFEPRPNHEIRVGITFSTGLWYY